MTFDDDDYFAERAFRRGEDAGYYSGMMSALPTQAEEQRRAEASRARAIRAVVAAQWAVMVAVRAAANTTDTHDEPQWWDSRAWHLLRHLVLAPHADWTLVEHLVLALPTAEQIVDGAA